MTPSTETRTDAGNNTDATDEAPAIDRAASDPGDGLVEVELLVEEISIDGMCGVY